RRITPGSSIILNTSFRVMPTMRETIRRPSLRRLEKCLPAAAIPTLRRGLMCCKLNAFRRELRQAVIETVSEVANQCDSIRCDMAMLMLKNTFERTWGARAGVKPVNDYWTTVIPAIKGRYREFRF